MARAPERSTWLAGAGEMARLIRAYDWAATPLGQIDAWPQSLRTTVELMLASQVAMSLMWGSDGTHIYNDAYRQLIGPRDDIALGRAAFETFAEARDGFVPHYAEAMAGRGVLLSDQRYPFVRREELAEARFDISYTPVHDERGDVAGVLSMMTETTGHVLAERMLRESEERQAFLLELSDALRSILNPVEVQAEATRLLAECLGTTRAYYAEVHDGRYVIEREYPAGEPIFVGNYSVADLRMTSEPLLRGEPLVATDLQAPGAVTDHEHKIIEALGLHGCIAISLIRQGELRAVFTVVQSAPRAWTAADVALVRDVADRTWAEVERGRAEAALRESRAELDRQAHTYKTTLSTISDFAYIFDRHGRFIFVNQPLLDLWGLTLDAAVGRNFHELPYPDELAATLQRQIQQVIDTGESVTDETLYTSPTGESGYYEYIFNPVLGADGAVASVAGSTRDITERKRAEAALRASEARFRGFAEASADTLWIVDAATGQVEYLSPAFERMWGEPREAVLGTTDRWIDLVLPDDRARVADYRPRVLAGERLVVEYRIIRPVDGAVRWIRDAGFPIRDETGWVRRGAGIAQDITDQKRANEEREAFVDAAAHDLKNPLTTLRGQTQLLRRRARQGRVANTAILESRLGVIDAAAGRMVAVIDEMLDAAHLRAERILDLHVAPIDLVDLVEAAAVEACQSTTRHTVRVETELPSLVGRWDGTRLRRVLDNLLGNAIKYSPEGGDIVVRVERELADGQAWAVLLVRDQGIGIPAVDLARLFERFRRGGNVARIRGTGIGLAGAKQLVEQHGGTIAVASEEGRDSTFVVRLPLVLAPRFRTVPRPVVTVGLVRLGVAEPVPGYGS